PNQPIEIARLELVGVARERGDVADAVIARAALEEIAERERRERGIDAGAAAADDATLAVDAPALGEEPGAADAVVDIVHTPTEMQAVAVGAAEAGAAAVVHVEHRDAAGPPNFKYAAVDVGDA